MTSLRDLGWPTLEEVAELGLTPRQFRDIAVWMQRGQFVRWWKRAHLIAGWEVREFIRSMEKS